MVHAVERGRHRGWEIAQLAREQEGAMSRQAREAGAAEAEATPQVQAPAQVVAEPQPGAAATLATNIGGLVVQANLQTSGVDTLYIDGNANTVNIVTQAAGDIIDEGDDTIIIEGNANDLNWITQAGGKIIDRGNDTIIIRGNANDVNIITQAAGDIIDEGDDTIIIEGNANDLNWVTQAGGNNNEVNILSQSGAGSTLNAIELLARVSPGDAKRLRKLLEEQFRAVNPQAQPGGRPLQHWEIARKDQLVLEAYIAERSKKERGDRPKLKVTVDAKL